MDRQEIASHTTAQLAGEWCWSDAYKELNGMRPRHTPSHDELVDFWVSFPARAAEKNDEDAAAEAYGLAKLEAAVANTMALGATSRQQAFRWLMDADGVDTDNHQDVEHFFWGFGVSFKDLNRFTKEVMER
jgi:hypothetical protein